jgi:hypothetical protein
MIKWIKRNVFFLFNFIVIYYINIDISAGVIHKKIISFINTCYIFYSSCLSIHDIKNSK